MPVAPAHQEVQERRDAHRARHRDAVGGGQVRARLERDDERDARDHDTPVDLGDVDLALGLVRGVDHRDARRVAELHRLVRERERARDQRLARDDRGQGREDQHRDEERRAADQVVERVRDVVAALEEQRALAEVVEEQAREHDRGPGEADRRPTEVSHVGVQRLATGDAQHDRTEQQERRPARRRWRETRSRSAG